MNKIQHICDVAVIGGGLAGTSAAVAVAKAGFSTLHVAPAAPPDRRTSALMMPSVEFLRAWGLIDDPETIGQPLARIRIIDGTRRLIRAPEALFEAEEFGHPAFGWNFANAALAKSFEAASDSISSLQRQTTTLKSAEKTAHGYRFFLDDGSVAETKLLVGADGKRSMVRDIAGISVDEKPFGQSALVCDLKLARPVGDVSVEFHYEKGPFTLVPAGADRANLVWIDDHDRLQEARESGAEGLAAIFEEKSQHLVGAIALESPAFVFPLGNLRVDKAGRDGICLVGESAHAFPPIGAQGLNLGLRDAADLVASLREISVDDDDWGASVAKNYATRRRHDLQNTGLMVDTLYRSLLADFLPTQALRSSGLWALKMSRNLRRKAFALGMGAR